MESSKRREWVKTAAIIFLSVLLVLTFFSNTIMNYSLPEVAAKYVESGTVTAKVREQGVVESSDLYNVTIQQTRKVASVAVKAGDKVEKGGVLVYLEDEDSPDLKAAQDKLKKAQQDYDAALLAGDVGAGAIQNAQNNIPSANYRQQITNAQMVRDNAQSNYDAWKEDYDGVSLDPPSNPRRRMNLEAWVDQYTEAKKQKDSADFDLANATKDVTYWNSRKDLLETKKSELEKSVSGGDTASDGNAAVSTGDAAQEALKKALEEVEKSLETAKTEADKAAFAKAEAARTASEAQNAFDSAEKELKKKIAEVKLNVDAAEKMLKEAQKNLDDLVKGVESSRNLTILKEAILDAEKEVSKELEKSVDAVIKADIAGTVITMNAAAGKEVSAAEAVAVIQPEGRSFTMRISVDNEKAKRLAVGDKADLVNAWRYDNVNVVIAAIRPDSKEPSQKKQVIFNVTGEVTAGQTLNISVGQKSANYDTIVPNSAIREDNNGKFVLQVVQKASPLGNRYVAERVDVEVLASDETKSAVKGAIAGYEFVITTSNKPVEAGQLVRLADESK